MSRIRKKTPTLQNLLNFKPPADIDNGIKFADICEVPFIEPAKAANIVKSTSNLVDVMIERGVAKVRLAMPDIDEQSEHFLATYKSLVNKSSNVNDGRNFSVAKLPSNFIRMQQLRNLGHGIIEQTYYKPAEAIKKIKELDGVTVDKLNRMYSYRFGECSKTDDNDIKRWAKNFYAILNSLEVDPEGTKDDVIWVPYPYSHENFQADGDEDASGLHMDSVKGSLLDIGKEEIIDAEGNKSFKGKNGGINNAMLFFGFPGSVSGHHLEDGNSFNSMNYLIRGHAKIWCATPAKYCEDVRNSVKATIERIKREHPCPNMDSHAATICSLQNKRLLLTPEFFDNHNIPYEIVIQKEGELMLVSTGCHHGIINSGLNLCRAVNYIGPDYCLLFDRLFVQHDGHVGGTDCQNEKGVTTFTCSNEMIKIFVRDSAGLLAVGKELLMEEKLLRQKTQLEASHLAEIAGINRKRASSALTTDLDPPPSSSSQNKKMKKSNIFMCTACRRGFHNVLHLNVHIENNVCAQGQVWDCPHCKQRSFGKFATFLSHEHECKQMNTGLNSVTSEPSGASGMEDEAYEDETGSERSPNDKSPCMNTADSSQATHLPTKNCAGRTICEACGRLYMYKRSYTNHKRTGACERRAKSSEKNVPQ